MGGTAGAASGDGEPGPEAEDDALDRWLHLGLHRRFGAVAREPVPEELLRLLEEAGAAAYSGLRIRLNDSRNVGTKLGRRPE
jgi:hypothetical protein